MTLDPNTLRTGTEHLGAVEAMKTAFDEPDAVDVTTDEDLLDRNVRIQWTDGTIVQGVYDKHAEMFASFVSKARPGMTNQGAWLGAVDAPWSENLANEAEAPAGDATTDTMADYDAAGTALIEAAIARGVPVVEHTMTSEEAYSRLLDRRVGEFPEAHASEKTGNHAARRAAQD